MSNTMTYRSYIASITVDPDAGLLHGEVVGARDVITFQATTVRQLGKEFKASINDYLNLCEERKITPDKSYSGVFSVRTKPEAHRKLAMASEISEAKSLNAWAADALEKAADEVLASG